MVGDLAGSDREIPHDQRLLVAGVELENDPGPRQAEVVRHADAVQDLGDGMDLECFVGLLERHARRAIFEDVDPVRVLGQGPAIGRPGLDLIDQGLGQIEFGGVARAVGLQRNRLATARSCLSSSEPTGRSRSGMPRPAASRT